MTDSHNYRHDVYDSLHDSAIQRKFRSLAPMPFGVVFLPWKGMRAEEAREHFRLMKRLGFTNLKQTVGTPEWPADRILEMALEEGIIPYWYGTGGWQEITPELLESVGLPSDMPTDEAIEHPAMIAYQAEVIRRRIAYDRTARPDVGGGVVDDAGVEEWAKAHLALGSDPELPAEAESAFKAWLRTQYPTIEELIDAWNQYEVGICDRPYESWEDLEADEAFSRHTTWRDYGFIRDVLRFKADYTLQRIRRRVLRSRERDPHEPMRAGGEMGLFLPFAWRGTDMEGIAEEMREAGSFYPSIHLAWHFEEVGYEMPITVYMQSSISVDWFKGGWAATWESTGGPQQFSGGKGWHPKARDEIAAFTVSAGTMTQLLLSYLAGGFKGVGLWAWNYRRAGWEGGEYSLLNRQLEPTDRAIQAGRIAKAANRLRRELWNAHKEPFVGVFHNWDNDAIWAAISVRGREVFKHVPVRARVGISRALIRGNVPWEHVTPSDLRAGLAPRYRAIYLPAQVALSAETLRLLRDFVEGGGRVVMDAPGGWFDERGVVLDTAPGSEFEHLFGAVITDYQYSSNVPRRLAAASDPQSQGDTTSSAAAARFAGAGYAATRPADERGRALDGFIAELRPTTARPAAFYDTGEPAVTRNRLGTGEAIIIGYEASHSAWKPGNTTAEEEMRRWSVGDAAVPYRCLGTVVYRLAAPETDHYFFINDGPAKSVVLETPAYDYTSAEDVIEERSLDVGGAIELPAHSGRWLRMVKR